VAITGGATATTNDLDPTTVMVVPGVASEVPVMSIAGQTMTTLVQPNGT
jgi:hypothetical protein